MDLLSLLAQMVLIIQEILLHSPPVLLNCKVLRLAASVIQCVVPRYQEGLIGRFGGHRSPVLLATP